MESEKLYYRRRSASDDWEPVDRAEYARCVICIDGLIQHCRDGAAVAEVERSVIHTGVGPRLRHAVYSGPAFEPGERVWIDDDVNSSLTRARGCNAVVVQTVGPFVAVKCDFWTWPAASREHCIRCVLPEFLRAAA